MLPPPNPTGVGKGGGSGHQPSSLQRPAPYPLHNDQVSSASTSTDTSGASSSSSGGIPTVATFANFGKRSGTSGPSDTLDEMSRSYDDSEDMPKAGPSRPYARSQPQPRQSLHGFGSATEINGGYLKGKKIRFSLTMAQEPIHGRRKTEKDRRPLAHCPILRLRMRQVHRNGTEVDLDVSSIEPSCFICAAELFEVSSTSLPSVAPQPSGPPKSRPPLTDAKQSTPESGRTATLARPSSSQTLSSSRDDKKDPEDIAMDISPKQGGSAQPRPASWAADGLSGISAMSEAAQERVDSKQLLPPPLPPNPSVSPSSASSGSTTPHNSQFQDAKRETRSSTSTDTSTPIPPPSPTRNETLSQPSRPSTLRTAAQRSSGSSGDGDSTGVKPSSKRPKQGADENRWSASNTVINAQRNLFGSLHVPAVRVIAPEGDLGLWFLFTDLSVRQEGTFALRFRVFDITAAEKTSGSAAPTLAEARSQAFKVYSPRNFPGLPKPTELAEHFNKQGFKLNTRKNERQAKTPPPEDSSDTGTTVPQRPEAHPVQSSHNSADGEDANNKKNEGFSSSSEHLSNRPGTAGTTTTTTNTTGSASFSGTESAGTVVTVATSVSSALGSSLGGQSSFSKKQDPVT